MLKIGYSAFRGAFYFRDFLQKGQGVSWIREFNRNKYIAGIKPGVRRQGGGFAACAQAQLFRREADG